MLNWAFNANSGLANGLRISTGLRKPNVLLMPLPLTSANSNLKWLHNMFNSRRKPNKDTKPWWSVKAWVLHNWHRMWSLFVVVGFKGNSVDPLHPSEWLTADSNWNKPVCIKDLIAACGHANATHFFFSILASYGVWIFLQLLFLPLFMYLSS